VSHATGSIEIRFYGQLGDFLPRRHRQRTITVVVTGHPTVREVAQSLGVPHPEIGLLAHKVEEGMGLLLVGCGDKDKPDDKDKADFTLDLELRDTSGEAVAVVNGVWQIRKIPEGMESPFPTD